MRVEHIGPHTLYLGDCREILPTLGRVDAVVTDPPYGLRRTHRNEAKSAKQRDGNLWGKYWPPMVGDDADFDPTPWLGFSEVVLWGGNHFCSKLPDHNNWLVWFKGVPEASDYSDSELAWTSKGTGAVRSKHILWSGFRRETEVREHYHPTQKPVALMEWCLSFVNADVILDPYMGSGSTGVACVKLGRKFIGIEIEEKYHSIACRRIEEAMRQPDMFVAQAQPAFQEALL